MKLSIIVPAHNEADNISNLIIRIEKSVTLPHELLIVNDHSQDNTASIVSELAKNYTNVKLIENNLDKGFGNAIKTGLRNASCDVLIPVMGDLCDDLNTVNMMFQKIEEGFDVVCGSRYMKGGARIGGSKIKAFFSGCGGRSIHFLLGIPTHDIPNAFKMYKKKVVENMEINANDFSISMEMPLKAYFAGFKITEVPTAWRERTMGKSTFKVFKLLPNYLKLYFWAIGERLKQIIPHAHK